MTRIKSLMLGAAGAALLATSAVSTAEAQSGTTCDLYARQYAAAHAPGPLWPLGAILAGGTYQARWDTAYRFAFNRCMAGGPSLVATAPVVTAPVVAGTAVAAPVVTSAAVAASAALAAPAAVATAVTAPVAAALAPPPAPRVADVEPVVRRNYVGSFEPGAAAILDPPATTVVATPPPMTTVAALEAPAVATDVAMALAPAAWTPEWHAYCAAKYRSFDPATGMYLSYSGEYRLCR